MKTVRNIIAILGYSIFLRLCYCLLVYGKVLLYGNWKEDVFYHAANVVPMAVMAGICLSVVFCLTDRGVFSRKFILKSFVDALLTCVLTAAGYFIMLQVYKAAVPEWEVDYAGIFVAWTVTFLITECLYYMKRSRREILKAESAKRREIQYRYEAFRAQVNPHFLFNSLNMLMDIIETDREKAVEFTQSLSDIYRYVLRTNSLQKVRLAEEMEFLKSYFKILQLKYNNFLDVHIGMEAGCGRKNIIPFTMQLLLENVTKHNVISENYPMDVWVTIGEDGMTVANRIVRKKSDSPSRVGLKYISSQYEIYGKSISVSDDGTCFTVKIPYI